MTREARAGEAHPGLDSLLQAAVAATPTGIVISDPSRPDSPITFMNPAFTAITGYGPEDVLGRNCRFLQGKGTDPRAVARVRRALAANKPVTVELLNYRRDGSRFWNELRIAPVFDAAGQLTCHIGIQHDISARKRAEEALRRAKRAAERANRTKSDFLATMSHEIRTPMSGMLGTISLLLDTALTTEQRSYAETAQRCGQDMLAIINDILDISRIEAGMLALDEIAFPLAALVEEVRARAAPAAARKGIALTSTVAPGLPTMLMGDPQRLRQVLLNLLDNAVKFTAIGAVSLAVVPATDAKAPKLRIVVSDTGIGIPTEVQARLFRSYAQADASIARRFGGSGLGLTICRRLVRLMGGEITLASEAGRGATFTITLPLRPAPTQAGEVSAGLALEHPSFAPTATTTTKPLGRILLAEDSRANQLVAAAILRKAGYEVTLADDGEEVVGRAAEGNADLVLMDMQMPRRNGIEATAAIRALPGPRGRVPILAMTASAMLADREASLAAGMDGHLAKPVDAATLLSAVAAALAGLTPHAQHAASAVDEAALLDQAVLAELRAAVGPAQVGRLLMVFIEETEDRMRHLAAAMAKQNLMASAQIAHGLRSAAGSFGAMALMEAARLLEQSCMHGDAPGAARVAAAMEGIARRSLQLLGTGRET